MLIISHLVVPEIVDYIYLVTYLRKIGFVDPESGGKHQYLLKGNLKLVIPNPHESDIGIALLSRLLKQVDVSRQEWENL